VAIDHAVDPLGVAADRDARGDRLAARQCGAMAATLDAALATLAAAEVRRRSQV